MSNNQRAVNVKKQIRRIENRRRFQATQRIAAMPLTQQMALACDLWRIERRIATKGSAT